ncbi:MAG: S8 family serine peptidase [Thermoleophilia bacterium]
MRCTKPAAAAVLLLATAAILVSPATATPPASGSTIIELRPAARCSEAVFLANAGGTLVASSLNLYRVPNTVAARVVSTLRLHGALRFSAPNRIVGSLAVVDFADPLVPTEWWRAAVGVDTLTPPPAGRAVTAVDSGIDVSHPEFLGRANTEILNPQEPVGIGGEHGTAVVSLIAAPVNGLGLVGIYPEALVRSWDAARGAGTALDTVDIVQGILAAANLGPGVVNLSLGSGGKELAIEQAIYEAVSKGILVVAASGNDGDTGNPLGYPASIPHVLTVGASDRANRIATFSSRSPFLDLAAPGVAMPIATAIGKGWRTGEGTSFAAPLVSGASAWVWTVRPGIDASQLFEIMRRSAVDIGLPGRDDAAGYGLLNVPAALAYPTPPRDPSEPNDDIEFVRPGGLYDTSLPALTTPAGRMATIRARLDRVEDPRDVYRVWLPKNSRVTATVTTTASVDLSLWKQDAVSVVERLLGTDRLARATARGLSTRLTFYNQGPGRFAFLAVAPSRGVREATYRLRLG